MSNTKQSWIRYGIRVAVAAILLALLFQRVDFNAVWNGMRVVGPLHFAWATAVFVAIRGVLALQMYQGIRALKVQVALHSLFRIQLISNFYNLVLPGDIAGGGVVWYKLFRESGNLKDTGLLMIFFRLLNTFTVVVIGAVAIGFDQRFNNPALRGGIFALLALFALAMLPFFSKRVFALVMIPARPVLRRLPAKFSEKIEEAERSVAFFAGTHSAGSLVTATGLSLLHHALGVLWMWGLAHAFGLDLSFLVIAWIRTLLTLLQLLPVTIAGLGVREVSLAWLLGAYGVSPALAVGYGLGIFTVNLLAGLIGGGCEAWEHFVRNPEARPSET